MMNKKLIIFACILMTFIGCKLANDDEFITVDVAASVPEKELTVQDFMDVEYVPLETNDDFVVPNNVAAIGESYIVMRSRGNEGSLYFFDRHSGKAFHKFNHRGQGPEEYAYVTGVILDEENQEVFINDAGTAKMVVYDLQGNFKRSFAHREGGYYMTAVSYDSDHLIVYDASQMSKGGEPRDKNYYLIISKADGCVTDEVPLPYETIKSTIVTSGEVTAAFSVEAIVPYQDDFLICEASTDTIYRYTRQHKLIPFMAMEPTENPEQVLAMGASTRRYQFFTAFRKELIMPQMMIPSTPFVYDKEEHRPYEVTVYNADFKSPLEVRLNEMNANSATAYTAINADKIVEAYEEGKLQGPLLDLAASIDEEDNPVIMFMKEKQ